MKLLKDFFALDAIRNFTAITAVVIAFIGGRKVLGKYKEQQLIAASNFYAPLRIYLMRLNKSLLGRTFEIEGKTVEYPFSCALFALSEHANFSGIRLDNSILKQEIENVNKLSKDLLDFLSKADNQFPDSDKKMRSLWYKYLNELIDYLIDFENLNRGITVAKLRGIPEGENTPQKNELIKQITEYYKEVKKLIKNILVYINGYEGKILGGSWHPCPDILLEEKQEDEGSTRHITSFFMC